MARVVRREPPELWESEIVALEARARAAPRSARAIVFAGSSSIRLWSTLERDMAPLEVRNHGFGGAQTDAVLHYAPRVLLPYVSSAMVLYAGENDLETHNGKEPGGIAADLRELVLRVEDAHPAARIFLISIKPSPARRALWTQACRLNERLRSLAAERASRAYLDVATPSFDARGRRRRELFLEDGLHLSPAGYALWTTVVRPPLLAAFGRGAS